MYKLDFSTKWKIHNIFHVSLLKQKTSKKEQINELFPESEQEFDIGNNKKYKVEAIKESNIYAKKTKEYLPGLYYLVFWKSYPKKENT